RMPRGRSLVVDGTDVVAEVYEALDRMGDLTDRIHSGQHVGATGERIKTIINIGIGGPRLGPPMAHDAPPDLRVPGMTCLFVSNVDPSDLEDALAQADPASTMFVVASKTFTTVETLTNARVARDWMTAALGTDPEVVSRHFVAVSANLKRVTDF